MALILALIQPAVASGGSGMSFGDGLAFFLIIGITVVGILACLGAYSRRLASERFWVQDISIRKIDGPQNVIVYIAVKVSCSQAGVNDLQISSSSKVL